MICDALECFKVGFECPEVASELVSDIFELFDLFLFLFIILARNIDFKSILQKTLKQFGLVASKYERKSRYKSNFQCVSLRRRVCLCPVMSGDMFLQSAFQFGFCIIDSTIKSEGLFLGLQSNLHLRRATSPQQAHLYNTFFGGQFIHCLYNGHRYVRELKKRRWRRQRQQQKNQ